jgi:ABC-type multidrug transport system ATPase subunit
MQAKMLMQLFSLSGAKRHSYLWLSSTQIKKLAMAMALASSPTVLILDEPCVGMDRESSEQLWRYLISLKSRRTIIVSSTRLEEIELYCDRMLLLVKGKVVCYGKTSRIKRYYSYATLTLL